MQQWLIDNRGVDGGGRGRQLRTIEVMAAGCGAARRRTTKSVVAADEGCLTFLCTLSPACEPTHVPSLAFFVKAEPSAQVLLADVRCYVWTRAGHQRRVCTGYALQPVHTEFFWVRLACFCSFLLLLCRAHDRWMGLFSHVFSPYY
jgi:hypothetical protein